MKTIPSDHLTQIATGTTRLAWAITITRADGEVYRYCSSTRNKTIDGQVFLASPGFTVSNITCTEGPDVVDTLQVTMIAHDAMIRADFLTGRWNGALFEIQEFDWANPAWGGIDWPTYRVSDVQPVAGGFVLELRDRRVTWGQDFTLYTGKECQNRLGDARCQIDLGDYTFPFEVTAVTSARRVFTVDLADAADYYTGGYIVFDTGNTLHAGLILPILDHATGGVITLATPLISNVEVGMTGNATAGCLKRLEDCRDKFGNVPNMRAPGVHAPTVEDVFGG